MNITHRISISPPAVKWLATVLLLAGACLANTGQASAQAQFTETIAHSFFGNGSVPSDGYDNPTPAAGLSGFGQYALPVSGLIPDGAGNYYGVTPSGGSTSTAGTPASGDGTVFEYTPATGAETVLHNFGDGSVTNDGINPTELILSNGVFYGTTFNGGANGDGAVFSMTESAPYTVTILYSFGQPGLNDYDGVYPSGTIAVINGTVYGAASQGGYNPAGIGYDYGMVYGVPIAGGNENYSILFGETTGSPLYPTGVMTDTNGTIAGDSGTLYVVTSGGGSNSGGTLFSVVPSVNNTPTILYNFGATGDGNSPGSPPTIGTDGNFYGTTQYGGSASDGTVYEINSTTEAETILHSFNDGSAILEGTNPGLDGEYPVSSVIEGADGNLYGATAAGGEGYQAEEHGATAAGGEGYQAEEPGTSAGNPGYGVVYQVVPAGTSSTTTIIHTFAQAQLNGTTTTLDGLDSLAPLVQATDGSFYGTTEYGGSTESSGSSSGGAIFQLVAGAATAGPPTTSATLSPASPNGSGGDYFGTVTVTITPSDPTYSASQLTTTYTTDGSNPTTSSTATTVSGAGPIVLPFSSPGAYTIQFYSTDPTSLAEAVQTTTFTNATAYTYPAGLQMLSAPYQYSSFYGTTPFNQFLGTTSSTPDIVTWNPAASGGGTYVQANTLNPGQGYWANFQNPTPLDSGPAVTETPYPIILQQGWNMIGDPYTVPISLANQVTVVSFPNGNDIQNTYSFLDADNTGGLIYAELYTYAAGATNYTEVGPSGSLQPYAGYWIYAIQACTLDIASSPAD